MSFTSQRNGDPNAGTIVAVAALHIAAAYALINGLGVPYIKETIANLPTRDYTTPPPPERKPAQKPPKAEAKADALDVVKPAIDLPLSTGTFKVDVPLIDLDNRDLKTIANPPPLPPIADFKPVAATPRNNPASWVSTNDYPSRDIRQGNEGTTVFRLAIDARGKVMSCEIIRSSGHRRLDDTACRKITGHAAFEPARDVNGSRVAGSYTGKITWVIPR